MPMDISADEFAYNKLQEKYGISGQQRRHDLNHVAEHPSFEEGILDENTPILGISPEEEAIVTVAQIILWDVRARYNEQGQVVGASQGSSSNIEKDTATLANHPITVEELKTILGIEVLIDTKTAIRAEEKRNFYEKRFSQKESSQLIEEFVDYYCEQYGSYKEVWDMYLEKEPLDNQLNEQEIKSKLLIHPSFTEAFDDSIDRKGMYASFINEKFLQYKLKSFKEHWPESEAKQRYDALQERIDNRDTPCPIFDQALEYYIKRAELIKEQLKEAGYSNISNLSKHTFDAIPVKLFAVTHEKVIEALHKDNPEIWELPTTTLKTQTIEHTPPEQKVAVSAGRGGSQQ